MSLHYYVWYRVERDDRDTDIALRGMMARLGCHTGIPGRLMKKRDEPRLWMEVYEGVRESDRFERALRQAIDEFDVEMFIDGDRRTECFLEGEIVAASCGVNQA